MIVEIASKLLSESLLSLYPIFVKNIGLPLSLQTWSRFFSYAFISGFFIDYPFVIKAMMTSTGMMLSLITMVHIYTSYRGFELLESGVAYSIFYLYPIMIVLMAFNTDLYKNKQISYQKIIPIMFLALFGVFLLVSNSHYDIMSIFNSPEGVMMLLLAAFTEASIYFLVKNIKTTNNWNHIFISYIWGAIFMSLYFIPNFSGSEATFKVSSWRLSAPLPNIAKITGAGTLIASPLSASLGINIAIGLCGYLLRFFAISRLDPLLYASLSYFGIVMAFVYGIFLNGDIIDIKKIAGAVLIIISNLILMRDYVKT